MIGGESGVVKHLGPIFATIAPGIDSAARTPGRTGKPDPAERGFLHCGPNGAGHFVKMVHNGIEYGMMASFAEGLNILHNANAGTKSAQADAETAPMEDPEFYQFDIDTTAVTEVWRRGSVIESWLLDLTAAALFESPSSRSSPVGCRTPARADGPRSRQLTKAYLRPYLRPRSIRALPPAGSMTSLTKSSPPCARASAATTRSRPDMTKTAKPVVVLFDVDETLVSQPGWSGARSWDAAFKKLYGIPADIGKHSSAGETDAQVARATFKGVLGRDPTVDELAKLYAQCTCCTWPRTSWSSSNTTCCPERSRPWRI
jgi:hypothetical protein